MGIARGREGKREGDEMEKEKENRYERETEDY